MRQTRGGGGEAHGWVAKDGRGGAHQGGGVGGGTRPRFHGGEVPSTASSGQGVKGVRRALCGAIWAEEEGARGRKKWGAAVGWGFGGGMRGRSGEGDYHLGRSGK
jgi:hypothetical protein